MAVDWDTLYELSPSDTTLVKDTDDAIRSLKLAARERLTKEHEFDLASQARQGLHRAGSAVAFYQASAPTQRNGVDLADADAGLLWVDTDDATLTVRSAASWDGLRVAVAALADTATTAVNSDTVDSFHAGTSGTTGLRPYHGFIYGDYTNGAVYDALAIALPIVNDSIALSGSVYVVTDASVYMFAAASRTDSGNIRLYTRRMGTAALNVINISHSDTTINSWVIGW